MSDQIKRNDKGEITELGHVPWPGYRAAFFIAFGLGLLYLLLAFAGIIPGGH